MTEDHRCGWTRGWAILNTLATVAAAGTGLAALVIAVIALTS